MSDRAAAAKERIPPGQIPTTKWPVLHYGNVPRVDTTTWTFRVSGRVARPFALTSHAPPAVPPQAVRRDSHCGTRWRRLGNTVEARAVQAPLAPAGRRPR